MAALEQDRRHGELTPTFQITCAEKPNSTGLYADLHLRLTDGDLERLDEMTVTILNDTSQDHWAHGLPENVTQEQAEAFVWGPWEFNTGASEQVISNRTSRPRPYSLVSGKDWDLLSLHRTSPGSWMKITPEQWKREN